MHYIIEVVGLCNLKCPTCPNGNATELTRKTGLMKFELFKQIVDKIATDAFQVEFISPHSWGEPLMHPKIAEMAAYIHKYGFKMAISSNLNSIRHLEGLIKENPYQLRVSVSGFTNARYKITHEGGDIEKVKANMIRLRELLNKYNASTIIEVCYHKYIDNTGEEMEAMEKFSKGLGFVFNPVWAYLMPVEKSLAYFGELDDNDDSKVPQAAKISAKDEKTIQRLAIQPDELRKMSIPYQQRECYGRENMMNINFDGSVSLCCGVFDDKFQITKSFLDTTSNDLQGLKHKNALCGTCQKHSLHASYNYYPEKEMNASAEANVRKYQAQKSLQVESKDAPEVSIVTATYNHAQFIGDLIESVLSQSFRSFELIINDNASTDNTAEVVGKFKDARIKYFKNAENIGSNRNFMEAYKKASGKYILIISSDDYLLPDTLQTLHAKIAEDPALHFVYSKYHFVDKDGKLLDKLQHPGWPLKSGYSRPDELARLLTYDHFMSYPTALFRKSAMDEVPLTDEPAQDYNQLLRMMEKGFRSYFIDRCSAAIRLHGNQESVGARYVSSGEALEDYLFILERHITEKNLPALAGYKNGIAERLHSKMSELNKFPDQSQAILIRLKDRLGRILSTIKNISDQAEKAGDVSAENRIPQLADAGYPKLGIHIGKGTKQTGTLPLVSVIIPTMNRPKMLSEAVKSVLGQNFQNFEIIVINDGKDGLEPILDALNAKGKIVYLRNPSNMGRAHSRNRGLLNARGKYIAYLDDDDLFYPNHLQTLVDFLETSEYKAAYTDGYCVTQELRNGGYQTVKKEIRYSYDFCRDNLLVTNYFPIQCVMHEKSCLELSGVFDESLETHEDWDLWIRISKNHFFKHINTITNQFHIREDGSNTTTGNLKGDFLRTRKIIYDRYREETRGKPKLEGLQESAYNNHEHAIKQSLSDFSLRDFVKTITEFLESGRVQDALSHYEINRGKFKPSPELGNIERLMAKLPSVAVADHS